LHKVRRVNGATVNGVTVDYPAKAREPTRHRLTNHNTALSTRLMMMQVTSGK